MVKRIRIQASIGRQRVTKLTPGAEANYVASIRESFNRVLRNYSKLIAGLEDVSAQVLYDALEPTFQLSQKYCPKDTGALVDSGFLEIANEGRQAKVVIGYAKGGKPHYAAFVHELTHLQHKEPTRSKFLLTAIEQDEKNIQRRIIAGYRQATGLT